MSSPIDVYYDGFRCLPEELKKRLSLHDLRRIYDIMVLPALDTATSDLLEAVKFALAVLEDYDVEVGVLTDAIAKAEGRV